MATRGTNALLLINEYDFSCQTATLTVTCTIDGIEHESLCSTAKESEPGKGQYSIELSGYYEGKTEAYIENMIKSRLSTVLKADVAALFGTSVTGCPAYVLETSWSDQLTINMPMADLITVDGAWKTEEGMYRGLRIYTGAISATGTKTSIDLGAAGSAGGKAYLFVQSITGTATNADVDVESSATEAGVYASEGTFTFSDVGVQEAVMTGTVNRWLRINTTDMGGATGFTVVCIACVSGVTY